MPVLEVRWQCWRGAAPVVNFRLGLRDNRANAPEILRNSRTMLNLPRTGEKNLFSDSEDMREVSTAFFDALKSQNYFENVSGTLEVLQIKSELS